MSLLKWEIEMSKTYYAKGNNAVSAVPLNHGCFSVRVGGKSLGKMVPIGRFNPNLEYWPGGIRRHCDKVEHTTAQKCLDYIS